MAGKVLDALGSHHEDASTHFEEALHWVDFIIGWILIYGLAIALINTLLLMAQHLTGSRFRMFFGVTQPTATRVTLDRIKLESGRIIAYALLLLVAADVLETLLKPMHDTTMEDLYKMALVSAIRTALAYFLGKEIEEVMHHIEHEEHHGDGGHHHGETKPSAPVETKKTK